MALSRKMTNPSTLATALPPKASFSTRSSTSLPLTIVSTITPNPCSRRLLGHGKPPIVVKLSFYLLVNQNGNESLRLPDFDLLLRPVPLKRHYRGLVSLHGYESANNSPKAETCSLAGVFPLGFHVCSRCGYDRESNAGDAEFRDRRFSFLRL